MCRLKKKVSWLERENRDIAARCTIILYYIVDTEDNKIVGCHPNNVLQDYPERSMIFRASHGGSIEGGDQMTKQDDGKTRYGNSKRTTPR